jgi:hypothetical protein
MIPDWTQFNAEVAGRTGLVPVGAGTGMAAGGVAAAAPLAAGPVTVPTVGAGAQIAAAAATGRAAGILPNRRVMTMLAGRVIPGGGMAVRLAYWLRANPAAATAGLALGIGAGASRYAAQQVGLAEAYAREAGLPTPLTNLQAVTREQVGRRAYYLGGEAYAAEMAAERAQARPVPVSQLEARKAWTDVGATTIGWARAVKRGFWASQGKLAEFWQMLRPDWTPPAPYEPVELGDRTMQLLESGEIARRRAARAGRTRMVTGAALAGSELERVKNEIIVEVRQHGGLQ